MIRNAFYTVYGGIEYRIFRNRNGKYILVSHNKNDESKGFTKEDEQDEVYLKEVSSSDVGDVNSIHTYALYQGQKCSVEGEDDEHYFLRVEQRSIADKLKFEIRDRDDFVKTVLKQDVESVFEEKTPRPNYFK